MGRWTHVFLKSFWAGRILKYFIGKKFNWSSASQENRLPWYCWWQPEIRRERTSWGNGSRKNPNYLRSVLKHHPKRWLALGISEPLTLLGGFQPIWKICSSNRQIGSFPQIIDEHLTKIETTTQNSSWNPNYLRSVLKPHPKRWLAFKISELSTVWTTESPASHFRIVPAEPRIVTRNSSGSALGCTRRHCSWPTEERSRRKSRAKTTTMYHREGFLQGGFYDFDPCFFVMVFFGTPNTTYVYLQYVGFIFFVPAGFFGETSGKQVAVNFHQLYP